MLIERWFPDKAQALNRAVATHAAEDAYELTLREGTPPPYAVTQRVGQAAFRNVVLQAYDYRCAATGWRLIVPGAWGLIDAAHLIPYAETQNNDPRKRHGADANVSQSAGSEPDSAGTGSEVARLARCGAADSGQSAHRRAGWAGRDLLR